MGKCGPSCTIGGTMLIKQFWKVLWYMKMHISLLGIYMEKPAHTSKEKFINGDGSTICRSNKAKQNNTNQLLCPPIEEQSGKCGKVTLQNSRQQLKQINSSDHFA